MATQVTWSLSPLIAQASIGNSVYYLKDSEARVKIEDLYGKVAVAFKTEIFQTLPTPSEQYATTIGLVADSSAPGIYVEYLCVYDESEVPGILEWRWEQIGTTDTDLIDYLKSERDEVAGVKFSDEGGFYSVATTSLQSGLGLKGLAYKSNASGSTSISVVTNTGTATATFSGSIAVPTSVTGQVGIVGSTTGLKFGNVTDVTAKTTSIRIGSVANVTAASTQIKFGDVTGVTPATAQIAVGSVKSVSAKTTSIKVGDVTGVAAVNTNYTVATAASAVTKSFTVGGTQAVSATVSGEVLVFSINTQPITVATDISVQTTSIAAATSLTVTKQTTANVTVATDVDVTTTTDKTTVVTGIDVSKNTTDAQTILTGITTTSADAVTVATGITVTTNTNSPVNVLTGIATATFTGTLLPKSTNVTVEGTYIKPTNPATTTISITVS